MLLLAQVKLENCGINVTRV